MLEKGLLVATIGAGLFILAIILLFASLLPLAENSKANRATAVVMPDILNVPRTSIDSGGQQSWTFDVNETRQPEDYFSPIYVNVTMISRDVKHPLLELSVRDSASGDEIPLQKAEDLNNTMISEINNPGTYSLTVKNGADVPVNGSIKVGHKVLVETVRWVTATPYSLVFSPFSAFLVGAVGILTAIAGIVLMAIDWSRKRKKG